jgi:hypothetical protein
MRGLAAGFLTLVQIAASDLGHHYVTKRSESDVFVTWSHLDKSMRATKAKA